MEFLVCVFITIVIHCSFGVCLVILLLIFMSSKRKKEQNWRKKILLKEKLHSLSTRYKYIVFFFDSCFGIGSGAVLFHNSSAAAAVLVVVIVEHSNFHIC